MRRDKESTNVEQHLDTGMPAGTITALTVQQHQPTRVSVFLDGAFAPVRARPTKFGRGYAEAV